MSEELQGLQTLSKWLSSERDNLQGVVEKMPRELRELCRMLFGCKSERFIPSDPSRLKPDFEGVAQLQQEREYAALQESATISRNKPVSRTAKSTEDRQRRIVYDFGDHWVHDITLEAVCDGDSRNRALCLSGNGSCPPEDCGGPRGYGSMKDIFRKMPESKEADEYRNWLGLSGSESWDADAFDIDGVNAGLKRV